LVGNGGHVNSSKMLPFGILTGVDGHSTSLSQGGGVVGRSGWIFGGMSFFGVL
jgi:hypothetical protein